MLIDTLSHIVNSSLINSQSTRPSLPSVFIELPEEHEPAAPGLQTYVVQLVRCQLRHRRSFVVCTILSGGINLHSARSGRGDGGADGRLGDRGGVAVGVVEFQELGGDETAVRRVGRLHSMKYT